MPYFRESPDFIANPPQIDKTEIPHYLQPVPYQLPLTETWVHQVITWYGTCSYCSTSLPVYIGIDEPNPYGSPNVLFNTFEEHICPQPQYQLTRPFDYDKDMAHPKPRARFLPSQAQDLWDRLTLYHQNNLIIALSVALSPKD